MEQADLLPKIAGLLAKLGIPYFVTGGVAVVVWGRPRFTADIDIVIEVEAAKGGELLSGLSALDPDIVVDESLLRGALDERSEFNVIHMESGMKIDFWVSTGDAFHRSQMERRILRRVSSEEVFFASPEDLILSKLLWYQQGQSTRQLDDIESVLRIQQVLDWDYLRRWATQQSTWGVLGALRQRLSETA